MNNHFIEILRDVDIVEAAIQKQINAESALSFFHKSGLNIINKIVNEALGDYIENSFIEYSFISSTLDNQLAGLTCFSMISDVSPSLYLKKNIEKYCIPIIKTINKTDGYSIYHHPDLFIAPFKSDHIKDKISISFSDNLDIFKEYIIGKENNNEYFASDSSNIFVQNMSFKREYGEILRNAKDINERKINISVSEAHQTLHSLYQTYFLNNTFKSCYISIPIIGANANNILPCNRIRNNCDQGQGAIFIFFTLKISTKSYDNIKIEVQNKTYELFITANTIAHCFSVNYIFNLGLKLQNNARIEAIKSAKAAIMSRNMSHNLGSHVMAYLKQKLRSVEDIVKNNALSNFIQCPDNFNSIEEIIKEARSMQSEKKEIELPFLVGLGRFISYLQERQDYIATIATAFSPYYSSVNFKDFIYDELNPDHRFMRHSDRSGCKPDNILLSYIAMSEGLERNNEKDSNDIILKFREFNGINHETTTGKRDLEFMRNYEMSLPGGVVGRQALFSILENIIRNAAKHGNWRSKGRLELTMNILSSNDLDILGEEMKHLYNKPGIEDLYVMTITDNLDIDDKKLEKLKEAITEPYVNGAGEMINSNKGIKEMRISAAWLRGGIDDENNPNIIPVIQVKKTDNNNLQYIICVPRSKKVAIIVEESLDRNIDNLPETWDIFVLEEFLERKNKCYELIVVTSELIKQQITSKVPNRVVVETTIISQLISHKFSYESKLEELYKSFSLGQTKELPEILISDGRTFENNSNHNNPSIVLRAGDGYKNESTSFNGAHYIYRTHHQSEVDFNKFMDTNKDILNDFDFIEGISGHNSTDRLIRNEKLTNLWYYKHIHAMKTKVAIIDERLFTLVTGVKEADFNSIDLAKLYFEAINKETDPNKKRNILAKMMPDKALDIYNSETDEELEIIIDQKCNVTTNFNKQLSKDHLPIAYEQKGISLFTTFYDEDKEHFSVWGYDNFTVINGKYKAILKEIAIITNTNNKLSIKFTQEGEKNRTYFDYISIHQGLLDKIYDKFNYKILSEAEANTKKHQVTHEIHKKFMKSDQPIAIGHYLPKLIIHSGRSRPSAIDMPQKQPFIQFAAIEHALLDCKLSIVELLDFAQYE